MYKELFYHSYLCTVQYVLETSWIIYAVLQTYNVFGGTLSLTQSIMQSMSSLLFLQVSVTPTELVILCYIDYLLTSNLIATLCGKY